MSPRLTSVRWITAWLAATIASLAFFARPATAPLDEDEIYWLGSTYYFHLACSRAGWTHSDWELLPARENPPVAKYVLGMGLALGKQPITTLDVLGTFYLIFEKIPGAWGTGADYAKRAAVVERMNPELRRRLREGARLRLDSAVLELGRRVTIACAVLTSLILFLLGRHAVSSLGGLLASQLLLVHPVVVYAYNHAVADAIALVFSTAAAAATFAFLRRSTGAGRAARGSPFALAGSAGLLLGLACGAKMNSLVVALLAGASIAVTACLASRKDRKHGRQIALGGLVLFVVALAVFIAINPTMARDIPGGLSASVAEHRVTEGIQATFLSGHLVSLGDKFAGLGRATDLSWFVLAPLTLLAGWSLRMQRAGLRFVAAWYLFALVSVGIWIPFARGRYALPIILPAVLLFAGWSALGAQWLRSRIRRLAGRPG